MFQKIKTGFHYNDGAMSFPEHFDALRKTVIYSVLVLLAGIIICIPFADELIAILRAPAESYIESGVIRLQFSEPSAALKMWLQVALVCGIFLSMPVLIFIIGGFIMPGIRDNERRLLEKLSLFSGLLFLMGVLMGYKATLPMALEVMLNIGNQLGGESIWFYNKYINFSLQLLLGFGIAFQFPVIVIMLGKIGLITSAQLREKRKLIVVGILVLAMLLTPPDIFTQLMMAMPLIMLNEFCIWFLHFSSKAKHSAAALNRS